MQHDCLCACRATTNEDLIIETTRHEYVAAMMKSAPDPSASATAPMPLSVSADQATVHAASEVTAAHVPPCAPAIVAPPSVAHCSASSAAAVKVTSIPHPSATSQPVSAPSDAALTTIQAAPQPAMQLLQSRPVNPAYLSVAAMMWESVMKHMGSDNGPFDG